MGKERRVITRINPFGHTSQFNRISMSITENHRFQVINEQDEDGFYVADVLALRGCHTQGRTFEEALENIREVIAMCVREMREDGQRM